MRKRQKLRDRDYSIEPNRFTLNLLYNGEQIINNDKYGNMWKTKRDFDAPFREPYCYGNNFWGKVQDKRNKPHREENVFENSWEAVEMGEELIKIFRLKLRENTEDYVSSNYLFSKPKNNQPSGNYYTLVIVDNMSPKRDEFGRMVNTKEITRKIDELNEKQEFESLSKSEQKKLSKLKSQLRDCQMKREIFRCSFSADEYAHDSKVFAAIVSMVWKDFNINLESPSFNEKRKGIEYSDIDSYNNIRNTISSLKRQKSKVLEDLEEANEGIDSIRIKSLEKSISSIDKKISVYEKMYFRGIRSTIKHYMNLDTYHNRFTEKRFVYNNFHSTCCESEILKKSAAF